MNTAKLNQKLVIKTLVVTVNEFGAPVEEYRYYKTIAASLLSDNGSNKFDNGNLVENSLSFYTRFYPLESKGLRIEYNDQDYIINYIKEVGRKEAIIINVSSTV